MALKPINDRLLSAAAATVLTVCPQGGRTGRLAVVARRSVTGSAIASGPVSCRHRQHALHEHRRALPD